MAQHISVVKGSEKLSPLHDTHHLSPPDRTQGPLATLQKLADESSAVQRVNALQDMANAQYPVQREVDEDEDALVRQDKTAQNSAPVQRQSSPERSNGLPSDLRAGIENLSGISMDDVTVQRNSSEPAKVGAHAFAQGTNIHLGPGQDKHLPHEAWHVVQQKQGRVKPTMQMKGVAINDDAGLEREADLMGARAMQLLINPNGSRQVIQFTKDKVLTSEGMTEHYKDHFDHELPSSKWELMDYVEKYYDHFTKTGNNKWRLYLGKYETRRDGGDTTDRNWYIITREDLGYTMITHYGPLGS